jgi:quercetin dioxygenase-like cupin family protein
VGSDSIPTLSSVSPSSTADDGVYGDRPDLDASKSRCIRPRAICVRQQPSALWPNPWCALNTREDSSYVERNFPAAAPVAEELTVLSDRVRVLTNGDATDWRYEVFEILGALGGGAPLHRHAWDEEFYVLDGTVDIFVEDSFRVCRAGESLRVPAGMPHGFRVGERGVKFLAFTAPGGASRLFRALHEAGNQARLAPTDSCASLPGMGWRRCNRRNGRSGQASIMAPHRLGNSGSQCRTRV